MLSTLLLVPVLGAALATLLPAEAGGAKRCRQIAQLVGWTQFLLIVAWLAPNMDWARGSLQLQQEFSWALMPGIAFGLALDHLSWLLLCAASLAFLLMAHAPTSGSEPNSTAPSFKRWDARMLGLACINCALISTSMYAILAAWQLLLLLAYLERLTPSTHADATPERPDPGARRYLILSQSAIVGIILAAAAYFQASGASGIEPSANLYDLQSQSGSWISLASSEDYSAFPAWTLSLQLVCCAVLLGLYPFHRCRANEQPQLLRNLATLLTVYALLRLILPLAPDHAASAAPLLIVWGVVAAGYAWMRNAKTEAFPALTFALLGIASWQADGGAASWLLLAVLVAAVAGIMLSLKTTTSSDGQTPLSKQALPAVVMGGGVLVLFLVSDGLSATLQIVANTLVGEVAG